MKLNRIVLALIPLLSVYHGPVFAENVGNWIEWLRDRDDYGRDESFDLGADANSTEIRQAFCLDNGKKELGKLDELKVTGAPVPVPVPAAV